MRNIPQTPQDWLGCLLLLLKAYILAAFLMASILSRGLREDGVILWLILGYVLSFLALFFVAIAQSIKGHRKEAVSNLIFAGVAILFGWQLLPYLAG